jgi:hypothetical protein
MLSFSTFVYQRDVNEEANYIIGVLYATTLHSNGSKALIEAALDAFLRSANIEDTKVLYTLYYEQQSLKSTGESSKDSDPSLDLSCNDQLLEDVAQEWKVVLGNEVDQAAFMQFEERTGMNDGNDDP